MLGNETHPPAPSLTKRRSEFRVSYCSKNRVVYHCQLNLQTFKSESFIRY